MQIPAALLRILLMQQCDAHYCCLLDAVDAVPATHVFCMSCIPAVGRSLQLHARRRQRRQHNRPTACWRHTHSLLPLEQHSLSAHLACCCNTSGRPSRRHLQRVLSQQVPSLQRSHWPVCAFQHDFCMSTAFWIVQCLADKTPSLADHEHALISGASANVQRVTLTTPPPDLGKQHPGTRTSGIECQRRPAVAAPSSQPARPVLPPAVLRQHLEARKPDQVQVLSGTIAWLCIWRMCCIVTGHDCAGAGRQHCHIRRREEARQGHNQHCTAMMGTGSPVQHSDTSNTCEWRVYLQAVGDPYCRTCMQVGLWSSAAGQTAYCTSVKACMRLCYRCTAAHGM